MEKRPAAFDELMALVNRLRLDELEPDGDPAVRAQLDRVADVLGVREQLDTLDPSERAVLLAFARSYLAQGLDLVDDPARAGAWTHTDPHAQGSASAVVATLLSELGLLSPGARILDVGTGVAGPATALCDVVPGSTVVGVDPWVPGSSASTRGCLLSSSLARTSLLPASSRASRSSRRRFRSSTTRTASTSSGFRLLHPGGRPGRRATFEVVL